MIAPVRFGIVSTAAINQHILAAAAASPAVEISAVASRSQTTADAYAAQHGIGKAYGTYDDLLADPSIEAVYISLPNSLHVDWSIRALRAGKHVLCEKPFDSRVSEVLRAYDAAEAADRLLAEAFMYRHHPQTELFAKLVRDEIGSLRTIRIGLGGMRSDGDDIRLKPELDGGVLTDIGCYCVSMARLLAGEPAIVIGSSVLGPTGIDVRFAGLLRFPGQVTALFDCGFDQAPSAFVEVVGSEGTLRAVDPFLLSDSTIELAKVGEEPRPVDVPIADSYRLELEDLAAAIRGQARTLLGREDALGQARVLEALSRSARESSLPFATR